MKHFSFEKAIIKIAGTGGAIELLDPIFIDRHLELLVACYCDAELRLLSIHSFAGKPNEVLVAAPVILRFATDCKCSGFFIAHNHPSGDAIPSEADKDFTKKLVVGSEALGIVLLDHLIFGDGPPYSFRQSGLI